MTFESPAGQVATGDPVRQRQLVDNLIDNAVKYTPTGGAFRVGTYGAGGVVRLAVSDTGEGIPSEHLPRVIDRFYQVDKARSREQGGISLGLNIVRSVVESHGGNASLTSTDSVGTEYVVELPAAGSESVNPGGLGKINAN